jgi:hypothetical protein
MLRRLSICGTALLTAGLVSLFAGEAQARAPSTWILSTTALQKVTTNSTISNSLSSNTVYQVVDPGASDDSPVLSNATITYHEYSGAQAAGDVGKGPGKGNLPGDTRAILLDQENWNNGTSCPGAPTFPCTSAYDLAHPVGGVTQAAQAVRTYNAAHSSKPLTLAVSPGLDLFSNGGLGCGSDIAIAQCYLNYNMAGNMAAIPGVDVIDLQAQSLEGDPGNPASGCPITPANSETISYWNFVCQAAAQARAGAKHAGKSIVIVAGLSTDPAVTPIPCAPEIEHSASNVRSLVSGFWMNVRASSYYPEAAQIMTKIIMGQGGGAC